MPQEERKVSQAIFSWQHREYVKYQKNWRWHVLFLLALALLVWWSISDTNYLFAVFLVLFYLVILIYENREPEIIDFVITPDGIKSGQIFYQYKELANFFIVYQDQGIKNLYFDFKNPLKGRLTVPVDGQDVLAVRNFLLQYLEEDLEREVEPLTERIGRWLKL